MPTPEELAFFLRNIIKNPKYDSTTDNLLHCNHLVQDTFNYFGYKGFEGLTANQIFEKCLGSKDFEEQEPEQCAWLVKQYGYLAVAVAVGDPHGHVSVVFPGIPVFSGKWQCHVPTVASTGDPNRIAGCNFFFKHKPRFFKLKDSTV